MLSRHVKYIAWHAGNWAYNEHSIGIEHAGCADRKMFTEEEYGLQPSW
ncbi:MAG: N-acetylmuramoyl-L-alanine amidase [Candidatus Brockarchaeota archaeon]|nr:N-acetylmuramoyl-L-alanine amidase [Candidatus Brockarchaeota archaeon]